MIRGSYYTAQDATGQGRLFTQYLKSITEGWFTEATDGVDLSPQCDGQSSTVLWYELNRGGKLVGIIVPKGRDTKMVADALRQKYGPETELHFPDFPRAHEAHLVRPASELAAIVQA